MRLGFELRCLIGKLLDKGYNKTFVAELLDIAWNTVDKWSKRRKHLKDRRRRPKEGKVNLEIELSILALRNTFNWGTARIQQNLQCAPPYVLEAFPELVQGVKLSRQSINNILKKHGLNGYKNKHKGWKFFRASKPNELWQLDPKGPFTLQGKKYWFVICIDDYSRFIIMAEQFEYCPGAMQIAKHLEPYIEKHKPQKILTDNNPFKKEWDKWCKSKGCKPLHAHPYYPQDKGKVERSIRNISEEFIYLTKKFPNWIKGKIKEYVQWHNNNRFHRGINNFPAKLFS